MEIIFDNRFWPLLLLGGVILGSGLALLLYFRNRETADLSLQQKWILASLRIISIAAVAALLAGPLVKNLRKFIQDPVLIIGIDNSLSVAAAEGPADARSTIETLTRRIEESFSDQFRLAFYTFGEQVTRNGNIDFTERNSDYGDFIEVIYNNHFNEKVEALLMVGDGIVNRGVNPAGKVLQLNYPVYTLGMGDTTAYLDMGIAAVRVNRNVFLNNRFTVEVDITYQGLTGQRIFSSIRSDNEQKFEFSRVVSGDGMLTFEAQLIADKPGLMNLTVEIEPVPGEKNLGNNQRLFVVNVIENKQQILILGNGMHPDIGAIRNVLDGQAAFEVKVVTHDPWPTDVTGYSLVILHQLPSTSHALQSLFESASRLRIPLWIIVGHQTYLPQLNQLIQGVEILPQTSSFEEAQVVISPLFTQFTFSEELSELLERFPPLMVPFARYSLSPGWSVHSTQRLVNIPTDRPLMAFSNRNGFKIGILMGEGIWRWRLYNYFLRENHHAFTEYVLKTVQYLAIRDNEDNFMIDFNPVYEETESIRFRAEVYNEAFEPVSSADIRLVLFDEDNREFSYLFDRTPQGYSLDAGRFPPGRYRLEAEVQLGDKLYTEEGGFAVVPVNAEQMSLQANHRLLYQLAEETGGRFWPENEYESMLSHWQNELRPEPFAYWISVVDEVLNLRWIFFVILLVLSVEWFLRKFWGIY